MNKRNSLQAMSLLIMIISVLITCVSFLDVITARSSLALAQKQAALVDGWADCFNQAANWMTSDSKENAKSFNDGSGHILEVECSDENKNITKWKYYTEWTENSEMNVWRKK